MDDIETLRKRYPDQKFDKNIKIENYNIFDLPFEVASVDEVRADGLIEHLSFLEEKFFFSEVSRVLKKNGILRVSTNNFEKLVQQWLEAKDDWQDFFKNDEKSIKENYWFGTYTNEPNNRWGYLTASIFGNQNGKGQFHKNCYTVPKIKAICQKLGFENPKIEKFMWKGDRVPMLLIKTTKG